MFVSSNIRGQGSTSVSLFCSRTSTHAHIRFFSLEITFQMFWFSIFGSTGAISSFLPSSPLWSPPTPLPSPPHALPIRIPFYEPCHVPNMEFLIATSFSGFAVHEWIQRRSSFTSVLQPAPLPIAATSDGLYKIRKAAFYVGTNCIHRQFIESAKIDKILNSDSSFSAVSKRNLATKGSSCSIIFFSISTQLF